MRSTNLNFIKAAGQIGRQITTRVTFNDGTNTTYYEDADVYLTEVFSENERLTIGKAFSSELKVKLYNPVRTIAYNIATITVRTTVLDEIGTSRNLTMGIYYPAKVETTDDYETLDIVAYDVLSKYKTIKYTYTGTTPVTLRTIYTDLSTNYNVVFSSDSTIVPNITVTEMPADMTVFDLIGYLAGSIGANAISTTDGKVMFIRYSATSCDELSQFASDEEAKRCLILSRDFQHERGLLINSVSEIYNASLTVVWGDRTITAGTGKGLVFENPFITTQARVNTILLNIQQGVSHYYTGEVDWFADPAVRVGDRLKVIDKDGNERPMLCSKMVWDLTGGYKCKVVSIGETDAEIQFSTESPTMIKINLTRTILQEAIASATKLLGGSTDGVVRFIDTNGDGINDGIEIHGGPSSPNTYLRINQYGLGISNDGGTTYANAITGEGIVASTITSGVLKVGGVDDDVVLEIYDTNNNKIGT